MTFLNFQYCSTRQQFPVGRLVAHLIEYSSEVLRNVNKHFWNTLVGVELTLQGSFTQNFVIIFSPSRLPRTPQPPPIPPPLKNIGSSTPRCSLKPPIEKHYCSAMHSYAFQKELKGVWHKTVKAKPLQTKQTKHTLVFLIGCF